MFKKVVLTCLLCSIAQLSFAGKIAIFDAQESVLRTKFAQKQLAEFESTPEFAKMKAEYEGLTADLELMDKERNQKSMTWSDEQKNAHLEKMKMVAKDRQLAEQKIKAEQNAVLKVIFDKFQPQLKGVVDKYMQENGIEIMIRREAVAVVLDEKKTDVTEAVSLELDKLK